MKRLSLFFLVSSVVLIGMGQGPVGLERVRKSKPAVDSEAVRHWVNLADGWVSSSDDGDYIAYSFTTQVFGPVSLVIKSTKQPWSRELPGVEEGVFSSDSREFIFLRSDTLYFLHLGVDTLSWVSGVSSYKGIGRSIIRSGSEWLAWQLSNDSRELIVHDVGSGGEQHFSLVANYNFDEGGHVLVMERRESRDQGKGERLDRMSLSDGGVTQVWSDTGRKGMRILGYALDGGGDQVSLSLEEEWEDKRVKTLWYYKTGQGEAEEEVREDQVEREDGLLLDGGAGRFSGDGRYIYITLQERPLVKAPADAEQVDVWSYRDKVVQSAQLHDLKVHQYMGVVRAGNGRVVRLEGDDEKVAAIPQEGDYVVVKHNDRRDRFWEKGGKWCELVSMEEGTRKRLDADYNSDFWFSTQGRWMVYYRKNECYSYELGTGRVVKISGGIPPEWLCWYSDQYGKGRVDLMYPIGAGGWVGGDRGLLIYDEYDVWEVDPSGRKGALNLTHGYGRSHHIKFRLAEDFDMLNKGLAYGDTLLLTAFDTKSKYNGFYRAWSGRSCEPERLTMGPWDLNRQGLGFFFPQSASDYDGGMAPMRLGRSGRWLVRRSSPTESPNYYVTEDMKNYRAVTDYAPERDYNWLTTELVTYPQLDGTLSQGVLYKPEDFDRGKKYPVIVQYYEQLSHRMYEYPTPDFTRGSIDIGWFVSHGYLVFTPDIHYRAGYPGASVYNTVEGAGRYLLKLPYVNGKRMGINGHSWGGYETYYLVTHSHLFAAALAGAGGSGSGDWISATFALRRNPDEGSSLFGREEAMDGTLWERPEVYLSNSPVMRADRVTMPLLMFHCKSDEGWEQAVEMYLALWRLGKRCWMLQYDHGGHEVAGKDCVDYTIRVEQFFDHYLKGLGAPRWMMEGVPARFKGLELRYEMDGSGREP